MNESVKIEKKHSRKIREKIVNQEEEYWNAVLLEKEIDRKKFYSKYNVNILLQNNEEEYSNKSQHVDSNDLIINGKSICEKFFLKEKLYKEKIRILEDTISIGKESFQNIKNDNISILKNQEKIIKIKTELENKALRKIGEILKLLGKNESESESDILSNLDLLEKLILQYKY